MRGMRRGKWSIGAVVGVAALLGTLGGTGVASAATSGFIPAGYVTNSLTTASHQITSRVKLPKLVCKKADTSSVLISTSIAGTLSGAYDAAGVIVTMACSGTTPTYGIFGVVDDSHVSSSITASAGDVVNVAVIASPTFETASFSDTTNGQGTFVNGTGFDPSQASADVQGGSGSGHFPKFKPVPFGDVTIDRMPMSKFGPTATEQVDGGGNPQISVGPLGATGKSFVATYITNT